MPVGEWVVIDSNVLFTVNGRSEQASLDCEEACLDLLEDVKNKRSLALDDGKEILEEYSHQCNFSGQPGVGDEFYRWAFDTQYTSCRLAHLTPHDQRVYEEFPDAPELSKFDRSDRKWIAVALGCDPVATIYNAVDSDYALSADALRSSGVRVRELCPDCLKSGLARQS